MKVLYIEAKQKNKYDLSDNEIRKLPKKLFLAYSIQYAELALSIKGQLEKNNIKITKFQQVLGCSKIDTKDPVFLIGTGRFHASNLFLQAPKIYVLEGTNIIEIPKREIEKLKAKRQTSLIKFLKADNIGILVTTKPGQESLKKAIQLKKDLKKKGKKSFIFMSNNLDISQFENFNIDSWVNTACTGLALDSPQVINISELPK
jgi:diphthamide biosynthesis enzyme Dph1/Dph2-like protein